MSYLLCPSTKTREFNKKMAITDTQVNTIIALAVKKRSYKIIGQSIRRLVVLVKVFYVRLLIRKYLYYFIIRYCINIIQKDSNKSYRLAYKID